jgi:cellulose synthase (UDP-forming)
MWASAYENTVAVPLFRAMFDLVLPKKLGFKVTPKGIGADESSFDFTSSRFSLVAAVITLIAILKGLWEFHFFGIEKDAYFFNLAWACVNLLLLTTALIVAYERPRIAHRKRIRKSLPVILRGAEFEFAGTTHDIDFSGLSIAADETPKIPRELFVVLGDGDRIGMKGRLTFFDSDGRGARIGIDFEDISVEHRHWILLNVFCDPATWIANGRSRSNVAMCLQFIRGLLRVFRFHRPLRRTQPRKRCFRFMRIDVDDETRLMFVTNSSAAGYGGYVLALRGAADAPSYTVAYTRRIAPLLYRIGLAVQHSEGNVKPGALQHA